MLSTLQNASNLNTKCWCTTFQDFLETLSLFLIGFFYVVEK